MRISGRLFRLLMFAISRRKKEKGRRMKHQISLSEKKARQISEDDFVRTSTSSLAFYVTFVKSVGRKKRKSLRMNGIAFRLTEPPNQFLFRLGVVHVSDSISSSAFLIIFQNALIGFYD